MATLVSDSPLRQAEEVCLLIADVSGYTGYLTGTELEHAENVMTDFVENIIGSLEPTFELTETEGDAVFVIAQLGQLASQLVLDVVDACYFGFRRHSRSVVAATTCECNACRQISSLDLKFVIHTGAVVRSRVARRDTVTGPAVILVHRLLKNSVTRRFGPGAYLLVTQEAMGRLGLDESTLRCSKAVESYEHLGEVPTAVIDMEERWQQAEAAVSEQVPSEEAGLIVEYSFAAPPAVVWDYLLDARKRLLWQGLRGIDEKMIAGRRDVGTVIHCAHGAGSFNEEIVEWRPFERFTQVIKVPGYGPMANTIVLRESAEGTWLEDRAEGPRDELQRAGWPEIRQFMQQQGEVSYEAMAKLIDRRGEKADHS